MYALVVFEGFAINVSLSRMKSDGINPGARVEVVVCQPPPPCPMSAPVATRVRVRSQPPTRPLDTGFASAG